jgi:DNA-binding transcriptional ArsR family regulator
MVDRLLRGPASVSELAQPLDVSLPVVLQHLAVLEATGLVTSEKTGRVRTCRLETTALRTAEQWIADRRTTWSARQGRAS